MRIASLGGFIENILSKYSLLTSTLVNGSGVSHGEKNGNQYEVLHDPFLVKYKTFLMLLVQNTTHFIPRHGGLELREFLRAQSLQLAGTSHGGALALEMVYTVEEFQVQGVEVKTIILLFFKDSSKEVQRSKQYIIK